MQPTAMAVGFRFELDVDGLSSRGRQIDTEPGSKIALEVEGDGPIGAHKLPSKFTMKATFDVEVKAPGATVVVSGGMDWEKSKTPGGEIPDLPESDAE